LNTNAFKSDFAFGHFPSNGRRDADTGMMISTGDQNSANSQGGLTIRAMSPIDDDDDGDDYEVFP